MRGLRGLVSGSGSSSIMIPQDSPNVSHGLADDRTQGMTGHRSSGRAGTGCRDGHSVRGGPSWPCLRVSGAASLHARPRRVAWQREFVVRKAVGWDRVQGLAQRTRAIRGQSTAQKGVVPHRVV